MSQENDLYRRPDDAVLDTGSSPRDFDPDDPALQQAVGERLIAEARRIRRGQMEPFSAM